MKEFSEKLQKNTVTFIRRLSPGSQRLTVDTGDGPSITMKCSRQTPNATAGPPFIEIAQNRLASGEEWRIVIQKKHADDAVEGTGFSWPGFIRTGDIAVLDGRRFQVNGSPAPRAYDEDGTVLIWAVDVSVGD